MGQEGLRAGERGQFPCPLPGALGAGVLGLRAHHTPLFLIAARRKRVITGRKHLAEGK